MVSEELFKKCNLTIVSYKSMGVFCCHGNQTKKQTGRLLPVFNCPHPFIIYTKLESYCFSAFGVVIKKIPFYKNLILPWKANEMATGHEMHKLGRQLPNDQNYHHFTSLLMKKMQFNHFFHYKSMGAFCSMATKPRSKSP